MALFCTRMSQETRNSLQEFSAASTEHDTASEARGSFIAQVEKHGIILALSVEIRASVSFESMGTTLLLLLLRFKLLLSLLAPRQGTRAEREKHTVLQCPHPQVRQISNCTPSQHLTGSRECLTFVSRMVHAAVHPSPFTSFPGPSSTLAALLAFEVLFVRWTQRGIFTQSFSRIFCVEHESSTGQHTLQSRNATMPRCALHHPAPAEDFRGIACPLHSREVCNHCWKKHIGMKIEDRGMIKCFCGRVLGVDEIRMRAGEELWLR